MNDTPRTDEMKRRHAAPCWMSEDKVVSAEFAGTLERELRSETARYGAIRKLNPRQFSEIFERNLNGENFDEMIEALAAMPNAELSDSRPL